MDTKVISILYNDATYQNPVTNAGVVNKMTNFIERNYTALDLK